MIFRTMPLDNPYKRSAVVFFMFNSLNLGGLWIIFDILNKSKNYFEFYFLLIVFFSIFLSVIGYFFPKISRLKIFILIMGFFGIAPIFAFTLSPVFFWVLLSNNSDKFNFFIFFLYISILLFWGAIEISKTKKIEEKSNYLKNEIKMGNGAGIAYINRDDIKDFPSLQRSSTHKSIFANLIYKLIPVSFLGYPLQRLITDTGGDLAIFAFLSVLTFPFSLYFFGKISSGYYLWVWLISRFEKQNGVRIYLWDVSN